MGEEQSHRRRQTEGDRHGHGKGDWSKVHHLLPLFSVTNPPSVYTSPPSSSPHSLLLAFKFSPSSPFIITGGEEDGEKNHFVFLLFTVNPHRSPQNHVFYFEKRSKYSLRMIYVTLHKSFLADFADIRQ